MNMIAPLASLLGIEVDHLTDRIKHAVLINTAMAIFGMVGASFLVAAGFMALAQRVGGINAALVFSGGFLLLALAVYIGMRIGEGRRKRTMVEKRRSSDTTALLTTATITALPILLRSPLVRTLGLPAAAIAAFLLVSNRGDQDED